MSVSSTTPATGTAVSVAVNVVNQLGIYVSGVPCTFQVLSQPGSGAVVDAGPKVTDVYGTAVSTLNVGTTPGTILVGAHIRIADTAGKVESAEADVIVAPGTAKVNYPIGVALSAAALDNDVIFAFVFPFVCKTAQS